MVGGRKSDKKNVSDKKINIAVDGYSSCGKSTLARSLARDLDYDYIDSGAMYRAVTLYAIKFGFIADGKLDEEGLIKNLNGIHIEFRKQPGAKSSDTYLNGDNVEPFIRGLEVARNVSKVASILEVRHRLVSLQRAFGADKGVVMDGRDIGTVVFPEAELKLFLVADMDIRAKRRLKELKSKGEKGVNLKDVRQNLVDRDYIDSNRKIDPLTKAIDAIEIDNSHLTLDELHDVAMEYVQKKLIKLKQEAQD